MVHGGTKYHIIYIVSSGNYMNHNFIEYVFKGDLKNVKKLIDQDISPDNDTIMMAIYQGHYHIVQYLIDNYISIDEQLILVAVIENQCKILCLFIDKGIDVDKVINLAAEYGKQKIIKYLAKRYQLDWNHILVVVLEKNPQLVLWTIQQGADYKIMLSKNNHTCYICFSDYHAILLKCGHTFHWECFFNAKMKRCSFCGEKIAIVFEKSKSLRFWF